MKKILAHHKQKVSIPALHEVTLQVLVQKSLQTAQQSHIKRLTHKAMMTTVYRRNRIGLRTDLHGTPHRTSVGSDADSG